MTEPADTVEHDLARLHELVRDRPRIAHQTAAASRRGVDLALARIELLSALAAYASDGSDSSDVEAAVDNLRIHSSVAPDVTVEVVVGLLITNRLPEALGLLTSTRFDLRSRETTADLRGWFDFLLRLPESRRGSVEGVARMLGVLGKYGRAMVSDLMVGSAGVVAGALAGGPQRMAVDTNVLPAELALTSGDAAEALRELDGLPEPARFAPRATAVRVLALAAQGFPGEAAEIASSALDVNPDDATLLLAASSVLQQLGRRDDALMRLDEAAQVAVGADVAIVRSRRGLVLCEDPSTREEGIEELTAVMSVGAVDAAVAVALAQALYDTGRADEALVQIDAAVGAGVDHPTLHLLRATVLRERGRHVEALAAVETASRLAPDSSEISHLHGELLEELERYAEAAAWYGSALSASTMTSEDARESAAVRLSELVDRLVAPGFDRFDDALSALDVIRDNGLESREQTMLRPDLLRVLGRSVEAMKEVEEARSRIGDVPHLLGTRAQLLVDLGRSAEALAAMKPVLAEQPDYEFGWSVTVEATAALARIDAALTIMRERFASATIAPTWRTWRDLSAAGYLFLLGRGQEAETMLADVDPLVRSRLIATFMLRRPGQEKDAARLLMDFRDALVTDDDRLEYADAVSFADGRPSDDAMTLYQAVSLRPDKDESPAERVKRGWAMYRSGSSGTAALRVMTRGLDAATDPMPFESTRASLVAACSDTPGAAATLMERAAALCRELDGGPDAGFASFVRRDFGYLANLTRQDARFVRAATTIDELQQQLGPDQ